MKEFQLGFWKIFFLLSIILFISKEAVADKVKWNEHRSSRFIIFYKDVPVDFVENVEEQAEDYYQEVAENLGFYRQKTWTFDNRAKIYIYDDQEDYVENAKQAGWSHGVANARQKVIRTFPSAAGFFDSTLPHELGHIIFREYVGFDYSIPLWLDEGVAMYQEKAKRWGANKAVKKAIKEKKFMSLEELSKVELTGSTDLKVVHLYYEEAASVVYYMIVELGEFRFLQFCNHLKSGYGFQSALQKAYPRFDSLEDLNRGWLNYLKQQ